jgi:hypothetical protein
MRAASPTNFAAAASDHHDLRQGSLRFANRAGGSGLVDDAAVVAAACLQGQWPSRLPHACFPDQTFADHDQFGLD